jgi:3-oxochol-4-en-24-oyl-CoA dehydrogenase
MSLALTDDAMEIAAVVAAFLEQHAPEAAVRRTIATGPGHDVHLWRRMADELQLQALIVPERHGGAGLGWIELGAVLEQLGAALACVPYLSGIMVAVAMLAGGDDAACEDVLPGIADGATIATIAFGDEPGGAAARQDRTAWRLTGVVGPVADGLQADVLLVSAAGPDDSALFLVDGRDPQVRRTALAGLDLTRPLARIAFDDVAARRLVTSGDGATAVRRARDLAGIALACEQVGGAQRALDLAVAHAKTRVQFGRPIGAFQAVKHKLADLLVDTETARAAAYHALGAAGAEGDDLSLAAAVAQAWCSDAFLHVAEEALQIHGGIGMSWEHPAHLYLRRAKSDQLLLGAPVEHRRRVAAILDRRAGAA